MWVDFMARQTPSQIQPYALLAVLNTRGLLGPVTATYFWNDVLENYIFITDFHHIIYRFTTKLNCWQRTSLVRCRILVRGHLIIKVAITVFRNRYCQHDGRSAFSALLPINLLTDSSKPKNRENSKRKIGFFVKSKRKKNVLATLFKILKTHIHVYGRVGSV